MGIASRNRAAKSIGTARAPKSSTNPIPPVISPTSTFISAASASPTASSAATASITTAKISWVPRVRSSRPPALFVMTLTSIPLVASAHTPTLARRHTNSKAKNATPKPTTTILAHAITPRPSAAGPRPIGPASPRQCPTPI
jgi:hypothetical protein